ncbi:helix-turn-helix domain-containing protein [Streptomyces sp. VNUA24]|uniref:helix-turn-helix transcriptional regulator n=1 Tax=Streptomyces sp. VNUA24 TaxID=3031131 RepID=UPI0023B7B7C2|nr:helix-turn-helix domain-containing protein [Streptomyces sp. VNUA24]WEH16856.1 helix-turn-helix domain-containing protein [Streptomyces sp. VNUA24]
MKDLLLTPKQVRSVYGIAPQTLANYRWRGVGPDYVKTGPGKYARVRYRSSAIERWLKTQTVTPGGLT